ncbi:hypothetical protein EC973_008374 [Apophysomyces ossiformis]|uniref:Uncharacterized protein n=1 Tax=Apophysomyces ossiformis TaxID=679940 RepID=A0A8H7BTX3_9FUNG|nr:hypothetical protein EC973_008374 [Apophysomyces ossiformis]
MNQTLFDNSTRTTNGVDSYQNDLYRIIKKKQGLVTNLKAFSKYMANDGVASQTYMSRLSVRYGRKLERAAENGRRECKQKLQSKSKNKRTKIAKDTEEFDAAVTVKAKLPKIAKNDEVPKDDLDIKQLQTVKKPSKWYEHFDTAYYLPDGIEFNMTLNANKDMSCYIDAPMEALLLSILPTAQNLPRYIDYSNKFDTTLYASFISHSKQVAALRAEASNIMRQFVWDRTPFKREMNDVVGFVEHFLAQTSTSLQSLFSISYRKRQSCSCTPSLERLEDLNYRTMQYVNPYHFKDRKQNDDTLGEKFSNWYMENFENSKKRKCHACNSIAIKRF